MGEPFLIEWHDEGSEPRQAPDPDYPEGIDLDISQGAKRRCRVQLPYPARRVGFYVVRCRRCGHRVAVTTAGRPDDPRSLLLACLASG
jgi:hypothetical protein